MRRWKFAAAACALMIGGCTGSELYSGGVPASEEQVLAQDTYYEVPGDPEASRVSLRLPGDKKVRGLLIDFYNFDPGAKTPRSQMTSMWGFAIVAHNGNGFWDEAKDTKVDGQSTGARVGEMIYDFIGRVADESGHPELLEVPILVHGMSRFGSMGATFQRDFPNVNVIGYTNIVSGPGKDIETPETIALPGLLLPGEHDGAAGQIEQMVELRATEGARLGAAMNWREGHKCGNCELLAFPFFDQVIRERLKSGGELKTLAEEDGWLASTEDWSTAAKFNSYGGDPAQASWLPNAYTAAVWRSYVLQESTVKFQSPKALTKEKMQIGELSASEPLTVRLAGVDGWEGALELHDGDFPLPVEGVWIEEDGARFVEFTLELPPGLHALIPVHDGQPLSRPGLIMLLE